MKADFCMQCGHPLETRDVGGTPRRACTACDFVHWGAFSIGVGALVVRAGKLLLVRRAQPPGKGFWTNPGGYIEQTEPIGETIVREVREETGVEARVRRIVAVRDQPRDVHNVYLAFHMEYVAGEPRPDGCETDGAGFFSPAEMADMNVANMTLWLAQVAFDSAAGGLAVDARPPVPLPGAGLFRVRPARD